MKDFLDVLKNDFIKKALYDIAKLLFLLVLALAVSLLTSNVLVQSVAALTPYKWQIGTIFTCLGGLAFLFTYQKLNRFRPYFPNLECDFQVIEKEVTYEYKDKIRMIYKKRNKIKALKKGLNTYRDKYCWTGRGLTEISTGIPEHTIMATVRKNIWQIYEIHLQKTLKKGEDIIVEAIWELEDRENKAVPFFSATIEEPTKLLKFNLSLSPELGVREITCETSSSIGAGKPFESFTKPLNKHGEASWEIRNPKLLYHYEVKWNIS